MRWSGVQVTAFDALRALSQHLSTGLIQACPLLRGLKTTMQPPTMAKAMETPEPQTTHQTPPQALPRSIREELPTEVAGKKNIYYKDLPLESKDRLWQMFRGSQSLSRAVTA